MAGPPDFSDSTAPAEGEPKPDEKRPDDKKQRIIHARISEQLSRELERKATRLGLSVSNLVRNVLQNTFGLVDDIVSDSAEIARSARGEPTVPVGVPTPREAPGAPLPPARVLGWQERVLGVTALCDACNALLPKGSSAALVVTDGPGSRSFLCPACLDARRATPAA